MFDRLEAERLTAVMQFALSVVFSIGFFAVAFVVLFGRASIPPDQLRLADTLFGVLGAVLAQQSSYWFARQRGQTREPPEPNPPRQPLPPG
jgi:hypothetical protein